jgi:hypothetical protein
MFVRASFFAILLVAFSSFPSAARTPASIPQPVAILTQALNAAGGTFGLSLIQDFTATGTITYFWAGDQVQGPATIRARGFNQFRLDAGLPSGMRTEVINRGAGQLKGSDGNLISLPLHNTVNLGILTFPYLSLSAALGDPLTTTLYVGLVDLAGRQAFQIRTQRNFALGIDPQGIVSGLTVTDYFVDTATNLLLKVSDMTHPEETLTRSFPHDLEFENYTQTNGANFPMLVREKIDGQTIWELHLSAVTFNGGLTDSDFVIQ